MRHKAVFRYFTVVFTGKTMHFFRAPFTSRRQRAKLCAQIRRVSFALLLVTRENFQLAAGGRFNAPFASRKNDRVGFALAYSKISDSFSSFGALLGGAPLGSEKAVELNYSLQVTPYWLVQPVFQYYVDVGANAALANAPVLGFRTKVNF